MRSTRRYIGSLQRRVGHLKAKSKFIIYCEGLKTEPRYFDLVRKTVAGALIDIETVGAAGVPSTIAAKAIAHVKQLRKSRSRRNSFEAGDVVWAVFDRDEHPCFHQAIISCENNNVPVAVSDPCFEVWLILHYHDYDKPEHRHDVQKRLETLCKDYVVSAGKSFSCDGFEEKLQKAVKRADRQYSNRVNEGILNPPYTTVHKLLEEISKKLS